MSALAEAVQSVLGSDLSKAEARAASVSSQLDAAEAKLAKGDRHSAEMNAALPRSVETGEGDPEKIAAACVAAEEQLLPLRRTVDALNRAKVAADAAVVKVREKADRDGLEAELRPLDAGTASGVRDFEKHLGPLSDDLSRAFSADFAASAIRAHLGLPAGSTLHSDLNDILRRLYLSLVEKHGDANGHGVGTHTIEFPVYSPSVDAPTAKRLGIV